ncbi:protein TASOR isoform X3 [Tachyglossus aculeatus]|uniref:protein TASOR isoform X3 n=1 Tax=Tachyglossus aculeatus TaxID=9261 RepID=UPI0018F72CC2|nr:protein TASOR isoform X3 [Tachyglossus aculeatus]
MAAAPEKEAPPHTEKRPQLGGEGRGAGGPSANQAAPEPKLSTQNGGGRSAESGSPEEVGSAAAAECRGGGRGGSRILAQDQPKDPLKVVAAALPKGPEELPVKRNFQIPRKSREKKALFQPLTAGSREFDDVLKILHSSYLEPGSVANFNYKRASLIHSELLEKEFTEKRRELKFDGRLEKELVESYAFLMVDRPQVQSICEKGLQVGQSKVAILGNPSMGIYLSKYADLLQANPLEPGATGDVVVFKIIKGRMKSVYDHMGVKNLDSTVTKSALDPTPKHECHVSKSGNRITSLLAYRAFELTQYYFYEYGFDELRRRPRHVCPYAVVSFAYKDDIVQGPKFLPSSRSVSFNSDRSADKPNYTLWRGQLLNKGKLLCSASLKSATRAFLPFKLPEKLNVDTIMSIEHLKQKIPSDLFYKETYLGAKEVLKSGMYCSLYEVVEKTRTGSNLENLIQKLEKEKLVLVRPLGDRGYLFFLSPCQMPSPYEQPNTKSHILHALFLFQEPRGVVNPLKGSAKPEPYQHNEAIPDITKCIQAIHFALIRCRKDTSADFNVVVAKYVNEYFKGCFGSDKYREFVMYPYESRLDDRKFLYSAPKNKSHIDSSLRNYIFGSDAYQLRVDKVKELMEENKRVHQFSPISDYEGTEENDFSKIVSRKRNTSKSEIEKDAKRKPYFCGDYDQERLKELINLIQCRKKKSGGESDTEDNRNLSGMKRKLENLPENVRKLQKTGDLSESCRQYEGGCSSDSPQSVFSLISGLGGHDTDMRQQDISDSGVTDTHGLIKLLLETLANGGQLDSSLARSVSQALGLSADESYEDLRQRYEYEPIPMKENEEYGQLSAAKVENVNFKDPHCSEMLETDTLCLKYPIDVDLRVSSSKIGTELIPQLKEDPNSGSVSSFDSYSPCPNTPVEHGYHRQHSSSNNGEAGMHWKLIPITGGTGRSPEDQLGKHDDNQTSDTLKGTVEDGVSTSQVEKVEEQSVLATKHPFVVSQGPRGTIKNIMLEEYNVFSRKIEEFLGQNNTPNVKRLSTPSFSAQGRALKFSKSMYSQGSDVGVQQYVNSFHEKLNDIVTLPTPYQRNIPPVNISTEQTQNEVAELPLSPPKGLIVQVSSSDNNTTLVPGPFDSDGVKDLEASEQPSSTTLGLAEVELDQVNNTTDIILTSDATAPNEVFLEPTEKETPKSPDNLSISTQPALSDFISQLQPEVFNSLVKIIKDVQKNTVKFYIHEEEENILCKEIKEYLTKLGNMECHPEQFLGGRSALDKLLIIIQNEDIASFIHKIPGLVTLKRLSCVSFAGVDSLDDVKNHTYNELFVSGGFIVSDESVLNPESVTVDNLKKFLMFLEELNTPDGKWRWKIHCKMQKKLKELGRLNTKALNLLTLLNAYQKKYLVEILSYHDCDSQTRNAPELDCLIRLQAQNIQQRHVVFLTEKNTKAFSSYADSGIVVATPEDFMLNFKSLVGYHNSDTGENCLPLHGANESLEPQSALVESAEKDEEDMSLDSGDEISPIEVCSSSHSEGLEIGTNGSHATSQKECSPTELQLPTDEQRSVLEEKTPKMDSDEMPPVTPVARASSEGDNFEVYPSRQLSMSHQFSHLNVLTHQTFLGTAYPVSSQSQEGGDYFLSVYSQNLDSNKPSSPAS